jgi:L-threonylcarbamoyladenylate synthase
VSSLDTRIFPVNPQAIDADAIAQAADALRRGGLVAFPTETVYGLGANALSAEAVDRIFAAKERPASDPIIVHLYAMEQLEQVAVHVPELARRLAAEFWPGPLTMVLNRSESIPANVSAGRPTVAVRMPRHPVALTLLRATDLPVAAPSANRFARPSATTAAHVLEDLGGRVDVVLDGGPTFIGLESTVLDLTKETPTVLRPGGVTLEMLRDVIPNVQLVSKYLESHQDGIEAPGMLLRHYSPRADVLLFSGPPERVISAMQAQARALVELGKRPGILAMDDEAASFADLPVQIIRLGNTLEAVGHNLFQGMRELDAQGVDAILVHNFDAAGMGAAINDRLRRAAEGKMIQV